MLRNCPHSMVRCLETLSCSQLQASVGSAAQTGAAQGQRNPLQNIPVSISTDIFHIRQLLHGRNYHHFYLSTCLCRFLCHYHCHCLPICQSKAKQWPEHAHVSWSAGHHVCKACFSNIICGWKSGYRINYSLICRTLHLIFPILMQVHII